MKTIEEVGEAGYRRGERIVAGIPCPQYGEHYKSERTHLLTIVKTIEDAANVIYDRAIQTDEANRETPEFEACRHDLNSFKHTRLAWMRFDMGVSQGAYESALKHAETDFEAE